MKRPEHKTGAEIRSIDNTILSLGFAIISSLGKTFIDLTSALPM